MVCPVCTFAVAAGVGILREFGIDDAVTGLWFGALIISSIAWMIDYLNRKNIHFLFRKILVIVSFTFIFIWPLYNWNIMGRPENIIFGLGWLDRLLFGSIIGGVLFMLAMASNSYLKKINEGKVVINYQKILIPLIYLILASIAMHLLIKIFSW
jgi:hypothetical protein